MWNVECGIEGCAGTAAVVFFGDLKDLRDFRVFRVFKDD